MKRFCFFAALCLFAGGVFSANAQDLIVLKDGNIIEAKVMEITPTEIRYRRTGNLTGPMQVIPIASVLSIRYENGKVEQFGAAAPAAGQGSAQTNIPGSSAGQQPGLPSSLLAILNTMPTIRIAGNNLKFDFSGNTWTARINGENFSTGTIETEMTGSGAILTLKQTHIWPGAAGKTAGRLAGMIPGGSAVTGALDAAGSLAGAAGLAGAIEAPGSEIVLEYKAGPSPGLSLVSFKNSGGRQSKEVTGNRLHTLGVSVGTSFIDPAIIATVHGTYSPVRNMFLELGLDAGFVSIYDDVQSYYSIYPFARVGFFAPFRNKGGWYIGAGGGYMIGEYTFYGEKVPVGVFAADFVTGFNLWNAVDISYSIRTNFGSLSHKLSAGYVYRF